MCDLGQRSLKAYRLRLVLRPAAMLQNVLVCRSFTVNSRSLTGPTEQLPDSGQTCERRRHVWGPLCAPAPCLRDRTLSFTAHLGRLGCGVGADAGTRAARGRLPEGDKGALVKESAVAPVHNVRDDVGFAEQAAFNEHALVAQVDHVRADLRALRRTPGLPVFGTVCTVAFSHNFTEKRSYWPSWRPYWPSYSCRKHARCICTPHAHEHDHTSTCVHAYTHVPNARHYSTVPGITLASLQPQERVQLVRRGRRGLSEMSDTRPARLWRHGLRLLPTA